MPYRCTTVTKLYRVLACFLQPALALCLVGLTGCQADGFPDGGVSSILEDPIVKSLQIQRIQIPGIPDQNIAIDNVAREITIQLPATLTDRQPMPTITLGCTNCEIEQNSYSKSQRFQLFLCQNPNPPITTLELASTVDKSKRVTYKLTIKPAGPLAVGAATTEYAINNNCLFPLIIRNFPDGYSARVEYTNRKTSEKFTGYINCCRYINNTTECGTTDPDQLWATFCEAVPGEYDFEIIKDNGRRIKSTQPLIVKKGIPLASGPVPILSGTSNVALTGINLFPDDTFEWLIETPAKTYRLPFTNLNASGHQARVDLPTSLAAGYYYAYVVRNGEKSPTPFRLAVIREKAQPTIMQMADIELDKPYAIPARLLRNQVYRLIYLSAAKDNNVVRLVRVDSGQETNVLLSVPESYLSYGPDGGSVPQFTLPATLTPGVYKVSVRHTISDTNVQESAPLERLIEVQ